MNRRPIFCILALSLTLSSCLPPADPYPLRPAEAVVEEALQWSGQLESYIYRWTRGQVSASIPDALIPKGISDSKNFYLKNPDQVTAAETWAVRYAKPINKDSLYAGIPDPNVTYLFLGTALAPFGSKLIIEGEFPRCRFFSVQISPPLDGKEYYAQRQFGPAEVSIVDADIEPLPGHTNPFRPGADRRATKRSYRLEFDLSTGNPVALNPEAHRHPYRQQSNRRVGSLLVYQGPLGHKTVVGTALPTPGDWNLGALWLRIYEPDKNADALGGVPMPKAYFQLPTGERYFIGSDFSALQRRGDQTIANRLTAPVSDASNTPVTGWFKSWGITRSMLSGICLANNWSRRDSGARVNAIDLGWTGRGEFQPAPANYEPHATTNSYASYLGRSMTVAPGMVAILTGRLPTFPSTRNGEPRMGTGQVRYWSICGIDQDPLSPLPATTIHAISDAEVVVDAQRNYIIAYSRPEDRPSNARAANGVSWVDWGRQSSMGLLMRWVNVAPEWTFSLAPQEHQLDWAHSDWAGSRYDSTLIGVNWRNGFMQCFLPKVHYMSRAEFEALGNRLSAEKIPVWVDEAYRTGPSEARLGTLTASSVLDASPANAAANANDGNYQTAWSSAFNQQGASLTADLGRVKTISAIKLFWDWIFFARDYRIEVSEDNRSWTPIVVATNENGQIDLHRNLPAVRARFVRLSLSRFNTSWYRLGEWEIYTNDCDCEDFLSSRPSKAEIQRPEWRIYPNPVRNRLNYALEAAPAEIDLELYDTGGRLIRRFERQAPEGELFLGNIPAGVYWLRAGSRQQPGWQGSEKIVVKGS